MLCQCCAGATLYQLGIANIFKFQGVGICGARPGWCHLLQAGSDRAQKELPSPLEWSASQLTVALAPLPAPALTLL